MATIGTTLKDLERARVAARREAAKFAADVQREIGRLIRHVREASDRGQQFTPGAPRERVSREHVAMLSGVSVSVQQRTENEFGPIHVAQLVALTSALDVDPAMIVAAAVRTVLDAAEPRG
jgi:hypothetical protein